MKEIKFVFINCDLMNVSLSHTQMSVKTDKDEEGNSGSGVAIVETNRFGFILGNGETDR